MTLLTYTAAFPAPPSCPHNPRSLKTPWPPRVCLASPVHQNRRVCVWQRSPPKLLLYTLPGKSTLYSLLTLRLPPRALWRGSLRVEQLGIRPQQLGDALIDLLLEHEHEPSTLCTILGHIGVHAQVAELQWQSELHHEQAEQAQATVRAWETHGPGSSEQPLYAVVPQPQPQGDEGASTERLRLEAAAAVNVELEAVRLTTERERRSAAEREDTLHAQVASLQQHLHAACTTEEPQATLEAGLEGRSRSDQAEARAGRGGGWCGGSRERTSARRSEGRGPCEAAQRTGRQSRLRRGADRGLPVGSGNRVSPGP